MTSRKPSQVRDPNRRSSMSEEERAFLCGLLRSALRDIRSFARTKDLTKVLAIAEAFHNVPDFILGGAFTWDYFVHEFEALKATTGIGHYLDSVNAILEDRSD